MTPPYLPLATAHGAPELAANAGGSHSVASMAAMRALSFTTIVGFAVATLVDSLASFPYLVVEESEKRARRE
jgi:hypothetical protein